MPAGPSRCSITAKATWRFNRLKLREIELDDGSYGLGHRAVLLIGGQCVQPCRILFLEEREAGDCVVPALDPAAPVDRTADANDRCAICVHGTVARLTLGAGHRCVTDRWTRHGSTPKRHVTKCYTETAPAVTGWRRYASPLFIMAHTVRAILLASETAASLRGRRWSNFISHSLACLLPGLSANRITEVAPITSNWRSRSLPARLMPPMRCLPPVECSFGVRPIQAAR